MRSSNCATSADLRVTGTPGLVNTRASVSWDPTSDTNAVRSRSAA